MPKRKILVVEDEIIVARDLQNRLRQLGFSTITASTAKEAIAVATEVIPDLALMDIRLGAGSDGIEATHEIQRELNIPVIYITAHADENTVARAKLTHPFGYIIKPFGDDELQTTIELAFHRHAMETELRKSEAWFRCILRCIGDAVIVTDARRAVTFMNPVAERLTAWSARDAEGRHLTQVFKIVTIEGRKPIKSPFPIGSANMRFHADHAILVSNAGTETHVSASAALILDDFDKIAGMVLVFRDITAQHDMTERLLSQQKVEAIGTLARGIAHDFSNIMAVITGYASSMADALIPDTRAHEDATKILTASTRARDLTDHLLRVARASDPERDQPVETVSLAEVVNDTARLLEGSLSANNITLVVKARETMPMVKANTGQLIDSVVNVFLNGIEAMRGGEGTITVDAVTREITRPPGRLNPNARPGVYAVLRIVDTGCGIPKERMDRIFEPFYTTKKAGATKGLGLTVVHSAVQSWGGWIRVRSSLGKGTSMSIYMPRATDEHAAKREIELGGETILVVDDKPEHMSTFLSILRDAGYDVLPGRSAEEGLALYAKNAARISVAIIDLLMPGRDGRDVLRGILRHDPDASIIMTSGFSRDYVRTYLARGGWHFLQKPVEKEQLLGSVARVLKQRQQYTLREETSTTPERKTG